MAHLTMPPVPHSAKNGAELMAGLLGGLDNPDMNSDLSTSKKASPQVCFNYVAATDNH